MVPILLFWRHEISTKIGVKNQNYAPALIITAAGTIFALSYGKRAILIMTGIGFLMLLRRLWRTRAQGQVLTINSQHPDSDVQQILKELVDQPINSEEYASETDFLRRFSSVARTRFKTKESRPFWVEIQLINFLSEGERRGNTFVKNMATLTNDLYLQMQTLNPLAEERMAMAALRTRFGIMATKTKSELVATLIEPHRQSHLKKSNIKGMTLTELLPGPLREAARDALNFISPKDLKITAFPSVCERWALSATHRQMLVDFYDRLAALDKQMDSLSQTPSVWQIALNVTHDNERDALEMLGGIVSQMKRPLRYVEQEVIPIYPQAKGADIAFAQALKAFYLLGTIHEKSIRRFGQSALYPTGSSNYDLKFWHYYAGALLAYQLNKYPKWVIRSIGLAVAMGYEITTFPISTGSVPSRFWIHRLFKSGAQAFDDVKRQMAGNALGLQLAQATTETPEPKPVKKPSLKFYYHILRLNALYFWGNLGFRYQIEQWKSFKHALEDARAQTTIAIKGNARSFFIGTTMLGWTGSANALNLRASEDHILTESKKLFRKYFQTDQKATDAFDYFLERAAKLYAGELVLKLRKNVIAALRNGALKKPDELATFYDGLLSDEEQKAQERFQEIENERIVSDFCAVANKTILDFNKDLPVGQKIAAILLIGSFASKTTGTTSDLDIQIIAENPGGKHIPEFIKQLRNAWEKRDKTRIDAWVVNLPFIKEAVSLPINGPTLVLSPYPNVVAYLSSQESQISTHALTTPKKRSPVLGGLSRAIYKQLYCLIFRNSQRNRGFGVLELLGANTALASVATFFSSSSLMAPLFMALLSCLTIGTTLAMAPKTSLVQSSILPSSFFGGLIGKSVTLPWIKLNDWSSVPNKIFSPNTKWIALQNRKEPVHIYDPETGLLKRVIGIPGAPIAAFAFSPDETKIGIVSHDVASSQNTAQLYDIESGELLLSENLGVKMDDSLNLYPNPISFSADGKSMAVIAYCQINNTYRILFWDRLTGKPTSSTQILSSSQFEKPQGIGAGLAGNGKEFFLVNEYGTVTVFDTATWEEKWRTKTIGSKMWAILNSKTLASALYTLLYTNADRYIFKTVSNTDRTRLALDIVDDLGPRKTVIVDLKRKSKRTIPGGFMAFSPDGTLVLTLTYKENPRNDTDPATLAVWNTSDGSKKTEIHTFYGEMKQGTLSFSLDNKKVIQPRPHGEIGVWDIETGQKIKSKPAFSPNHDVSGDGDRKNWAAPVLSPNQKMTAYNIVLNNDVGQIVVAHSAPSKSDLLEAARSLETENPSETTIGDPIPENRYLIHFEPPKKGAH